MFIGGRIWRGLGFIAPLIAVLVVGVVELVVNRFLGDHYFSEHTWPVLIALALASILLRPIGKWMNNPENTNMNWNLDIRSGDQLEHDSSHTFLFIPVQNWYYVLMLLAACILTIDICKVIAAG